MKLNRFLVFITLYMITLRFIYYTLFLPSSRLLKKNTLNPFSLSPLFTLRVTVSEVLCADLNCFRAEVPHSFKVFTGMKSCSEAHRHTRGGWTLLTEWGRDVSRLPMSSWGPTQASVNCLMLFTPTKLHPIPSHPFTSAVLVAELNGCHGDLGGHKPTTWPFQKTLSYDVTCDWTSVKSSHRS